MLLSRYSVWALTFLSLAACSKKDDDSSAGGSSSFPNIYNATKLAVPSFTSTTLASNLNSDKIFASSFLAGAVPSTTTNFGTAADWSTVSGASSNTIGQLLRDAGASGTGKSLWTLLSQVQGTVQTINTDWADSAGEAANCTAIPSTTSVTTPYWNTATGSIVTIADSGKYKCYVQNGDAITVFGRHKIEGAATTCTDAFEYYISSAYAATVPTTGTSTSYGATSTGGSASRFYYHGCDKTIKLQLASMTKYSGGTEFSLRTEVNGNVETSNFTIRSAWVDITSSGGGSANSIVGTGTTFKVGSTNGTFFIGDLVGNCPTSTTCATPTGAFNYCIENTGAANTTMAVASANTTCTGNATLSAAYAALTPITDTSASNTAGVPREIFTVSKAAMNLP
jgi:hypothetical protein